MQYIIASDLTGFKTTRVFFSSQHHATLRWKYPIYGSMIFLFLSEVAKTLDIIVNNGENVGLNAKSGSDSVTLIIAACMLRID